MSADDNRAPWPKELDERLGDALASGIEALCRRICAEMLAGATVRVRMLTCEADGALTYEADIIPPQAPAAPAPDSSLAGAASGETSPDSGPAKEAVSAAEEWSRDLRSAQRGTATGDPFRGAEEEAKRIALRRAVMLERKDCEREILALVKREREAVAKVAADRTAHLPKSHYIRAMFERILANVQTGEPIESGLEDD